MIVDVPVSVPVGVVIVAVTWTTPGTVPAVNVVVAPEAVERVPSVSGVTAQRAGVGVAFPNVSTPTARSDTVPAGNTVEEAGSTRSDSGAAPPTVSAWAPVTTPAPAAVRVAVPAVESW